jgi:predicted nuclease of restriction endonuclease-like (RecB) superfamily
MCKREAGLAFGASPNVDLRAFSGSANLYHPWKTSSHVPIMLTMVSSQTLPRSTLPDGYPQLLARLKREIGAARTRAALAVNEELIKLYWWIGTEILARQERDGWGGKVIDRLASDLRAEFPEMRGLSVRNLEYMRQFAASWSDSPIPPQPVAQLPWGHIRCLLDKADDRAARLWYAQSAVEHAWSRKVLEHHIATGRYEREGKALTNFSSTLPAPESELVQQILRSASSVPSMQARSTSTSTWSTSRCAKSVTMRRSGSCSAPAATRRSLATR